MAAQRAPKAPDDLDAPARRLWTHTFRTLAAQGTWREQDAEALHRYVAACQTARMMRAAAQAEPWTTGSTGQLVAHPGFKVASDADRDAARYAADLLLTPAARHRAGVKAPAADKTLISF